MKRDILTVSDALIEPPNESMVLRTITLICRYNYNMSVLLHTTQDMKDFYAKWMKPRGLLDGISYILNEYEFEDGVRVDTIGIYPQTIVVKSLRIENQVDVLKQIKQIAAIR